MRHHISLVDSLVIFATFLFSMILMFHTFSYDRVSHEFLIAPKLWSDFGAHIPLIRSFSFGPNVSYLSRLQAPQSPLFPGEPIRYHFGFYALVGILERLGLPIDWALNLPSALGMTLMLTSSYVLTLRLFKSRKVALIAVMYILFNGSLSFLKFFTKRPFSSQSLTEIVTNTQFASFGPWDGGPVTAFWTLNVYTNQRHLALGYGLVTLLLGIALLQNKLTRHHRIVHSIVITGILATLAFIHHAAASIALLFCGWFFLVEKKSRGRILVGVLLSIPFFLLARTLSNPAAQILWNPGYVMSHPLTFQNVVKFWLTNLGFHIVLIPLGFLLSPRRVRVLFGVPALFLFIAANLWQFSPDMINNHKYINYVVNIVGGMWSAYAIVWMATRGQKPAGILLKLCTLLLFFFSIFSGIIDFFPIFNESTGRLSDIAENADARYFARNTSPDAIVLNSTWFYHPASLAGRMIYSGYAYFTWSYGYDKDTRETKLKAIYQARTTFEACNVIQREGIDYIELSDKPEEYVKPNWTLWKSIIPQYRNSQTGVSIYDTRILCKE